MVAGTVAPEVTMIYVGLAMFSCKLAIGRSEL